MGPSVRTTFICVSNNATFFYRRNTIFSIVWQRRKITISFSPCPKTPVIYSEYGKTLFQELKQIHDIARKNIQQAQISQKKQYDKGCHPVSVEVGDTVLVKVPPKFKLDRTYHGPYRVYEVTGTNVKVKPVSTPDVEPRTISLQQVSKCKGNFSANQFWYGHTQHF